MSLLEAVANVVVGYGVAVATQMAVFPMLGLHASTSDQLIIGVIFTLVSLVRSYALRRLFEAARGGGGAAGLLPGGAAWARRPAAARCGRPVRGHRPFLW